MASGKPVIPFFTDQNVPDSVGNAAISAGHSLTRLRDVMDTRTADPLVGVACSRAGHVLVSHDKDFRAISKRLNITQRHYQTSLHRVLMRCPEPRSAERMREALSLIEYEWDSARQGHPMVIEIHDLSIRIYR